VNWICQTLYLDYVQVLAFDDNIGSTPGPSGSPNGPGKSKTPVIVGSVLGACIFLLWILALLWYYLRRRRRGAFSANLLDKDSDAPHVITADPEIVNTAVIGSRAVPLRSVRTKPGAVSSQEPNRYTTFSNGAASGSSSRSPPQSSTSRSEYPPESPREGQSDEERRRLHEHRPSSSNNSDPSAEQAPSINRLIQISNNSELLITPIPPTRQQELAASRMIVPDRPQ